MRLITRKNFFSIFCMVFTIFTLGGNFLEILLRRSLNYTQFNLIFSAVFALIGIAVLSQSYRLDGLSPLRAGILLYLITLSCVLGIVWLYGCFLPLHPDAFRDIFFSFSIPWLLFSLFYFRRLKRETNRMDRDIHLLRGNENPDGQISI